MMAPRDAFSSFYRHATDEGGYTLAEVAVALVLTSLILAAGYSTYGFAQQLVQRWQHGIRIETTAHQVLRDITQQIRAAETLQLGTRSWTVTTGQGRRVVYKLSDRTLLRNGIPMHGLDVRLHDVRLREVPYDPASTLPPDAAPTHGCLPVLPTETSRLPESADALDVGRPVLYRLAFQTATSLDTLRVCTTVMTRQPEAWSDAASPS